MNLTELSRIAHIVDGALVGDGSVTVHRAVADSRSAGSGDLFVAIPGERVDGFDFIPQAAVGGAVAALATRPSVLPTVVVPDPVEALGVLAREVVASLPDLTVVGVTGSSGKTSTKDLLAAVMARRGPVVAPAGSMNTEVGLPITALQCDNSTRTLVAEMGARGVGHVGYLCAITPPDIAVVLNVGSAHLGEFGSRDNIAEAKGEIVASLGADGCAVLNADDPLVAAMAARTSAQVLTYGVAADADMRITGIDLDELARASFTLSYAGKSVPVRLQVSGEHSAWNAAAAALAGCVAGLDLAEVADALASATGVSRWRMEISTTPSGVIVVNDAYNANPDSMAGALKSLAEMGRRSDGRTFAVLGEMKELGDESVSAHDQIGRLAVRLNIGQVIAIGESARPIHMGAAHEGSWNGESAFAADIEEALAMLASQVRAGDIVLIKASRGVGLERLAQQLGAVP